MIDKRNDKEYVMNDMRRCVSHEPSACFTCSHYTGTVGFGCMENLILDALLLMKDMEKMVSKNE